MEQIILGIVSLALASVIVWVVIRGFKWWQAYEKKKAPDRKW